MQSTNDHVVKKSVIIWHIAAYFFVIIANILSIFLTATPKMYEISTICSLVINLAATIILAFIVNAICTKFLERRTATDASVLISYYMPGTLVQSNTSGTESNDSYVEQDTTARDLSLPMIISVDRVTQHAEFVERGTMDEAIIDYLFEKSIN